MPLMTKKKRYPFIGVAIAGIALLAGCEADSSLNEHYSHAQLPAYASSQEAVRIRHLTLGSLTPVMREAATSESTAPKVMYYGLPGDKFDVLSSKGDYVQLENEEIGRVWIPSWYAEEASRQIQSTVLSRVELQPNTKASLFPGSQKKLTLNRESSLFTAYQWKDWYGVILPADDRYEGEEVYSPLLIWVQGKDLAGIKPVEEGLWQQAEEIGIDHVRSVIEVVLQQGVSQSATLELLGKPDVKESSPALNETNQPLQLGTAWRYEHEAAHLTVIFSVKGHLERWIWTSLLTDEEQLEASGVQYPYNQIYEFRELPLLPSFEVGWLWRSRGNLAYTNLEAATDDVLLVRGDDGGYSGMHYQSSLYAIEEETGKKLWQVDGGWEVMTAQLDQKREYASIFTRYDPKLKQYGSMLKHIRLSDGQVLWSSKGNELGDWMSSASNALVTYTTPDQKNDGFVSALDPKNGKKLWERRMRKNFTILNRTGSEPVVLLQEGAKLTGIHPRTGQTKWSMTVRPTTNQDEVFTGAVILPPRQPFEAEEAPAGWIRLRNELMLLDWEKGAVQASYPLKKDQFIEVVDETRLLVQSEDASQAGQAKTVFYDAESRKKLWSITGRGSGALVDGELVYLLVDGIPTAIHMKTGKLKWQSPRTEMKNPRSPQLGGAVSADPLLFAVGSDLILVNKEDGSLRGRIQDVLLGQADAFMGTEPFPIKNNMLYLGAANGYFTKLDLSELNH